MAKTTEKSWSLSTDSKFIAIYVTSEYNFCNQNSITIKLLLYHPKANPIKDVYAALMRRQMQWSHLISDKWAPRFHSLWSRSSFLVSTFHLFFVKETMCVVTFQPFKFVVREQKHNIEQELFMREITYYLCPQCWPNLSEFTFLFLFK